MVALRRSIAWPTIFLMVTCVVLLIIPEISATRFTVGGNHGWSPGGNYTEWAKKQHFYLGDWLFFVYDRNQMNVLEVNKTNYESCIADHPIHNWTTGAGRDVVPLNVTKHYYFISGNGFCFANIKLAILVENPPSPPTASPVKSGSPSDSCSQMVIQAALTIVAVWVSLFRFC